MATIGRLNYKIAADTDQLNAAMVMSKQQMRDAHRVMRETASPAQTLANELDKLQVLYEKGGISLEAYGQKMTQLKSSTPEAIQQQRQYAAAQEEARSITQKNTTAQERYSAAVQRLVEIRPHLSVETYNRELERLKGMLPDIAAREEKRAADKAKADRALAAAQEEARSVTQKNTTTQERYSAAVQRLVEIRPHLSIEAYNRELNRLKGLLPEIAAREEKRAADKANADRVLATAQEEARSVTQRNSTAQERYNVAVQRLNEIRPHLSIEAYNRELIRLRSTLPDVITREERRTAMLREARSITASVETADEQRARTLNRLDQLLRRNAISQETYNRAIGRELAASDAARMAASRRATTEETPVRGGGIGSSLMGYTAGMLTIGAAVHTIRETFNLTAAVETAGAAFEVLIGDVKGADRMVRSMKRLDADSILDFNAIAQAGKTLLGYGTDVEVVMPSLTALSAISMGNAEKFQLLSLAFGQVQARGRMTAEEVRQMVNAGFNPLQEIARTTGMSLKEVQAEMANGAVSAEMVAKALQSAVEAGGRFAGMNERLGQTGAGALAKLNSDVQKFGVEVGQTAMPAVTLFFNFLRAEVQGTHFWLSTLKEGFNVIGATLTGQLDSYLDAKKAKQDEETAIRLTDEATKEASESARVYAEEVQKAKDYWENLNGSGVLSSIAAQTRGIENAAKTEEANADHIAEKYKKEREKFFSEIEKINEEYQKMQLGEERYASLQQFNRLSPGPDAMLAGDQEARDEAFRRNEVVKEYKAQQEAIKERQKLEERLAKEKKQRDEQTHQEQLRRAEELTKKQNPAAALAIDLKKIDELRQKGLLDSTTYMKARQEAVDKAAKQDGNFSSATPATITKGSVEEYKQRYSQEKQTVDKQLLLMAKQEVLQKSQLEETKKIVKHFENQPAVVAAR